MPPAAVAIAAAVATAVVSVTVTNVIIAAILIAAINIAATLLMRRPSGRTNQGTEVKLKLDPTMPRQLVLGRAATGGSVVWAFTYGSSEKSPGGLYLVRIIALCDLPINAVVAVMEGKKALVFDGDVTTGWRTCTNEHITDGGNYRMMCRVYKGSSSPVADSNLVSWSGGLWTAAHKGTNMAYAIVRYQYDTEGDAFPSGEPSLVWVLDGVKCYDDRKDSTVPGGSGAHRIDNPATWEFTRNAAILAAQSLRGFYSNNVLLFGAEAETRDLNAEMLFSAYNTCDQNVSYSGGTQKRYEAGIMVNSHEALANYLQEFQAAFDGRIIDRGGAITLLPGATRTPVFNLTDDDIIWSQEKSWQPRATLAELYNAVSGVFVDEQTIFQEKGYPPLKNSTWETQDGGERLTFQVSYTAVTDWARVQRITKRIHAQSRYQGTVAIFLPLWAMEMEQGDWFTLTSERWAFTNKYFEVMQIDLVDTMNVMVIGRETSATIDGWDHSVDEKPRNDTTWNPPDVALPIPILTPAAQHVVNTAQQTEQFGVNIAITGIEGVSNMLAPTHIQIQISPHPSNTPITDLPTVTAVHQTVSYWGLMASTAYAVRGRATDGVAVGQWSAWQNFTTDGADFGLDVSYPTPVQISADYLGTVKAGQLPKIIEPTVKKGTTDVRTSTDTSYSVSFTNATGSVSNTAGSTKGRLTISTLLASTASAVVTVTYKGVSYVRTVAIVRADDAPPSGGGGGGSLVTFSSFNSVNSTSYMVWPTEVKTVALTAGQTLYGTGNISYQIYGVTAVNGGSDGRSMSAKWQYSVAGANTWVDFGSPASSSGSVSYPEGEYEIAPGEPEWQDATPGSITVTQSKSGLGAGNYDIRLVALNSGSGTLTKTGGTLQCQAAA